MVRGRNAAAVIHQKHMYNGHKLHHCTGWQGLTAPNGMIVQLHGPCIGTYNDRKMIGLSHLIDMLEGDFPGYSRTCRILDSFILPS